MKISSSMATKLMRCCVPAPPEVGGILGGVDETITEFFLDAHNLETSKAVYQPDILTLNRQLQAWAKQGIALLGLFHTHPIGQKSLSGADRKYITKIMLSMPLSINRLFFPLVIPGENIYAYYAEKIESGILIQEDQLEIL